MGGVPAERNPAVGPGGSATAVLVHGEPARFAPRSSGRRLACARPAGIPVLLGGLDEFGAVVADAVDAGADDPWGEDGVGQGVEQVLDVVFVGQVRVEPFVDAVARDDDR